MIKNKECIKQSKWLDFNKEKSCGLLYIKKTVGETQQLELGKVTGLLGKPKKCRMLDPKAEAERIVNLWFTSSHITGPEGMKHFSLQVCIEDMIEDVQFALINLQSETRRAVVEECADFVDGFSYQREDGVRHGIPHNIATRLRRLADE